MGEYLRLVLLPLSRGLRDSGGDPDAVWRQMGLDDWTRLPEVRRVLERHPGLLERIRGEFNGRFDPRGTMDLRAVIAFASDVMDAGDLPLEEERVLDPFRTVHFIEAKMYVLAWMNLFAPRIATFLGGEDSDFETQPKTLTIQGIEVRTDRSGYWVDAATLQRTDFASLRRDIVAAMEADSYWNEYAWTVDPILDGLRQARELGRDVFAVSG